MHTPQHTCANLFHEELEYWGIAEQEIQPCCWTGYHIRRDCNQVFNKVIREINTGKQEIFQSKVDFIPKSIFVLDEEDETSDFLNENSKLPEFSRYNDTTSVGHNSASNTKCNFTSVKYGQIKPIIWSFLNNKKSSPYAYVKNQFIVYFFCIKYLFCYMRKGFLFVHRLYFECFNNYVHNRDKFLFPNTS